MDKINNSVRDTSFAGSEESSILDYNTADETSFTTPAETKMTQDYGLSFEPQSALSSREDNDEEDIVEKARRVILASFNLPLPDDLNSKQNITSGEHNITTIRNSPTCPESRPSSKKPQLLSLGRRLDVPLDLRGDEFSPVTKQLVCEDTELDPTPFAHPQIRLPNSAIVSSSQHSTSGILQKIEFTGCYSRADLLHIRDYESNNGYLNKCPDSASVELEIFEPFHIRQSMPTRKEEIKKKCSVSVNSASSGSKQKKSYAKADPSVNCDQSKKIVSASFSNAGSRKETTSTSRFHINKRVESEPVSTQYLSKLRPGASNFKIWHYFCRGADLSQEGRKGTVLDGLTNEEVCHLFKRMVYGKQGVIYQPEKTGSQNDEVGQNVPARSGSQMSTRNTSGNMDKSYSRVEDDQSSYKNVHIHDPTNANVTPDPLNREQKGIGSSPSMSSHQTDHIHDSKNNNVPNDLMESKDQGSVRSSPSLVRTHEPKKNNITNEVPKRERQESGSSISVANNRNQVNSQSSLRRMEPRYINPPAQPFATLGGFGADRNYRSNARQYSRKTPNRNVRYVRPKIFTKEQYTALSVHVHRFVASHDDRTHQQLIAYLIVSDKKVLEFEPREIESWVVRLIQHKQPLCHEENTLRGMMEKRLARDGDLEYYRNCSE